jgi:eukaryotic-like serine/threonine-protein kinase
MKFSKMKWLFFVIAGSMLLSACGALPQASWPGVSAEPQNKYVYAAYAGGVFKVDSSNGTMVWRYPEKADAAKQFYAAPTATDELVVVGDYANTLFGLDPATRAEKWTFTEAKDKIVGGSLIVNKTILAPSADGTLYALSMDGKLMWKFTTGASVWATPVSDGTLVFVPSMDHYLYALNLSDGSQVWKTDLGASGVYGLLLDKSNDNNLYLSTMGNEVLAVTSRRGDILWRFKTAGSPWAVPVVKDGLIYIGDLSNKVYAISATAGTSTWQMDAPGPITSAPAVTSKGLVFASEEGDVFGVTFSGQKEWNQKINGKLYSAPVLTGDAVVVGVTSGENNLLLVSYDASGKQIWSFTVPQ